MLINCTVDDDKNGWKAWGLCWVATIIVLSSCCCGYCGYYLDLMPQHLIDCYRRDVKEGMLGRGTMAQILLIILVRRKKMLLFTLFVLAGGVSSYRPISTLLRSNRKLNWGYKRLAIIIINLKKISFTARDFDDSSR